jgi:Putative addiction module component
VDLSKKAARFPKEEQPVGADSGMMSLSAEDVWREEIRRRLSEIDSEAVKLIPWHKVRERLKARLER